MLDDYEKWANLVYMMIMSVCAILACIMTRKKKNKETPEEQSIDTVNLPSLLALGLVVVIATIIGIFKSSLTVSVAIIAATSILLLIIINKPIKASIIRTVKSKKLLVVLVVILAIAIIVQLLSINKKLSDVAIAKNGKLQDDVVSTNGELLRESNKHLDGCIQEGTEEVVTKLIMFQNEVTARNMIYQRAFEQADDDGYVFLVGKNYLTTDTYSKKDWRLLTKKERNTISDWFKKLHEENKEESLYALLDTLLSNDKIIRKLSIDESHDVEFGQDKKFTRCLTPFKKIGIIGGFLGELKVKHMM